MTTTTETATATVTKALLVRLEARPGKEDEVERLLVQARPLIEREPGTTAWFAVRFGRADYGIFDAFPDDEARRAHLGGAVAAVLAERAGDLLTEAPAIEQADVLADKLTSGADPAKGLLLTFRAKSGHEAEVADFLRGARAIVAEEPGTLSWFALALPGGRFGIFDVFPDNRARLAHLTGRVPRELAKHALSLLGSLPDMDKNDVLAAHLRG
jgi:quinol monooxygenase YgiN